jgi:hypothetical protein
VCVSEWVSECVSNHLWSMESLSIFQ